MRYEILGPVRLVGDGLATISARKIEILLATLLVRHDEVVSVNQLIDEIWAANSPRRATAALYVYISHLRKLLNKPGRSEKVIVTKSPGYSLRLGGDQIDFVDFQNLANEGRTCMRLGQHEQAASILDSALRLWRGPVLGEIADGPIINGFAVVAEEIRIQCTELMVSSLLKLGRHRDLIGFLYSLIAQHPLHEEFYRQLMLALYRSGRRADALKVYMVAHQTLREEVGLEPQKTLRELQCFILSADETLDYQRV
jgi:DNA-binding SARP family transcriptional activator